VAVFAETPVTENGADVTPAAIVMLAGDTVAADVALLANAMVTPPAGAGLARFTLPETVFPCPMLVEGSDNVIVRRFTDSPAVPSVKPAAKPVRVAEPLFFVVVTVNAASCWPVGTHTLVAGFCVAVEMTAMDGMLKASWMIWPEQKVPPVFVAAGIMCTFPLVELKVSRLELAKETLIVPVVFGVARLVIASDRGDAPVAYEIDDPTTSKGCVPRTRYLVTVSLSALATYKNRPLGSIAMARFAPDGTTSRVASARVRPLPSTAKPTSSSVLELAA
jgi:hypothetical protein